MAMSNEVDIEGGVSDENNHSVSAYTITSENPPPIEILNEYRPINEEPSDIPSKPPLFSINDCENEINSGENIPKKPLLSNE
mmetsp:Transcript_32292/g.31712  ORF Transcript_32292/g.31712 Transcript_32292/m.31712 type:complete len:82 (-) Transcript_32292:9-254(-)